MEEEEERHTDIHTERGLVAAERVKHRLRETVGRGVLSNHEDENKRKLRMPQNIEHQGAEKTQNMELARHKVT